MDKRTWAMPRHLEKYRKYISHTGKYTLEQIMDEQSPTRRRNPMLGLTYVAVKAQLDMLERLALAGLLK